MRRRIDCYARECMVEQLLTLGGLKTGGLEIGRCHRGFTFGGEDSVCRDVRNAEPGPFCARPAGIRSGT